MTTAAQTASPRSTADTAEPGTRNSELGTPVPVPLHRDYFERLLPACPIVCGRQLLPLSIGRYRLLHRFNVAFVADGEANPTAGDLLMGVLICSMRVEAFMAFAAAPEFKRALDWWARKFRFLPPRAFTWPLIGRLLEKAFGEACALGDAARLCQEIESFAQYIREGGQPPRYWDETDTSRPSASHWSHSIEATLREFQGWTREEINEEPLNKALWDYFKHCENQGLVRLMSAEEAAEVDAPADPAEEAAWLEYGRLLELAKAGQLDPELETQNSELGTP